MSAYDVLIKRGVTRLCHFTSLKNLTHILESDKGILASNSIRQDTKTVIDNNRYDGELDHICCTIQYPNSWFLKKAVDRNTDIIFKDWVVLYINLSILKSRSAKFCPCNASKDNGKYINCKIDNIDEIFKQSVPTFPYQRSSNMLSSCPTDGQAEVLIYKDIPRNYIIGIAVGNNDVGERVYGMIRCCGINQMPIYLAPDVLSTAWSNIIKSGKEPHETECIFSRKE